MKKIVERDDGFWRFDPPEWFPCYVCGDLTMWAWADLAWQHLDCDMYPSPEGDVKIVRGVKHVQT